MRTRFSRNRSTSIRSLRADAALLAGSAVIALVGIMAVREGGATVWWMAGACIVLAAVMLLRPLLPAFGTASRAESLDVSPWGLLMFDDGQLRDSVSWADLEEVAVVTTPDGPRGDDSYLVLRGSSGNGVIIPHAMAVTSGVLIALSRQVAHFDDTQLTAAMASPDDGVHIVWRAPTVELELGGAGDWQLRRWEPQLTQA